MNQIRTAALRGLAFAAMLACAATAAQAQANIDKLKQMKVASTDLNIPTVPQTGANAEAIKANLKRVKLPPGFSIALYAVVPDARHMAVAPSTNMLFVGTAQDDCVGRDRSQQRRHRDRGQVVRAQPEVQQPQRRLLDQRRRARDRRAQPRAQLPGGRILLRRPGRCRWRGGRARRARAGRRRELQPRRAHLPRRARQQALRHARPALQRAAGREGQGLPRTRHRRHRANGSRRLEARGLRDRRAQLGRPGLQPEGRHALVHRQPDRWHGRRHSARRVEPRDQDGAGLRLSVLERSREGRGHGRRARSEGPAGAEGRDLSAGRISGAPGATRHDVLQRQDVPREVPRRHLRRFARLVEQHGRDRRADQLRAAGRQ